MCCACVCCACVCNGRQIHESMSSAPALPLRLWAGLSCQRAIAGQINESMSGVPSICLPKLRSVKIQSVTLITQVPSQVCKYDVMCMELRTCHAESFAGLQICESIWSCAPCCTESLAQSASITQECMWGMSHNACGQMGKCSRGSLCVSLCAWLRDRLNA